MVSKIRKCGKKTRPSLVIGNGKGVKKKRGAAGTLGRTHYGQKIKYGGVGSKGD